MQPKKKKKIAIFSDLNQALRCDIRVKGQIGWTLSLQDWYHWKWLSDTYCTIYDPYLSTVICITCKEIQTHKKWFRHSIKIRYPLSNYGAAVSPCPFSALWCLLKLYNKKNSEPNWCMQICYWLWLTSKCAVHHMSKENVLFQEQCSKQYTPQICCCYITQLNKILASCIKALCFFSWCLFGNFFLGRIYEEPTHLRKDWENSHEES